MQKTLLFLLPASMGSWRAMSAGDWRKRWVTAGVGSYEDWNRLRVTANGERLWVTAGSPETSGWLDESRIDVLASLVAAVVGDVVPMEVRERTVRVRAEPSGLYAYRFPRLVVAKGGGQWEAHFTASLSPELRIGLVNQVERALRREFLTWDALPSYLAYNSQFVVLFDPGHAQIVPAVSGERSGHGKPVHALIRKGVTFLSPLRIDGDLAIGSLTSLGYGRMLRTAAPTLFDRNAQRALLALPSFSDETFA